jgi:two-component system nitrate/nitrite response regulator NarL
MNTRVLIISPIRIYREGIANFLTNREEITHVDAVSQFEEMMIELKQRVHDVILVDMAMDDACSAIRRVDQMAPDVKVVALAVSEVQEEIAACAEAGVAGLVTRDASLEDVVRSIEAAERSELFCPKPIAKVLLRQARRTVAAPINHAAAPRLSKQESRILHYIRDGCSNKEIARSLSIEVSTVKNHVHHILRKLNVQRRGEAAALMMKHQIHPFPAGRAAPNF